MKLLKRFAQLELEHRIIAFVCIMLMTILVTRLAVLIHNPNPVISHFEIHHFDYGILILFTSCLLLLFGNPHYPLYLATSAISFGLIVDDLWFIRSNINVPVINQEQIYNSTFLAMTILSILVILLAVIINHYTQKRLRKLGLKPEDIQIEALQEDAHG